MKINKMTIIRSIITLVALLNSILTLLGSNPLPFSNEEIYGGVSALLALGTTVWSWWKNNSFTPQAITADKILDTLKIISKTTSTEELQSLLEDLDLSDKGDE